MDITDAISTLAYLFLAGRDIGCQKAADADDDGWIDLTDPVSILGYLFLAGVQPPAPFPRCGDDPTADDLTCASSGCR